MILLYVNQNCCLLLGKSVGDTDGLVDVGHEVGFAEGWSEEGSIVGISLGSSELGIEEG